MRLWVSGWGLPSLLTLAPPHPILTLIPALRVPTAPSLASSPSAWVSSSSLTLSVACLPFGMAVPPSDLSPQMGAGST